MKGSSTSALKVSRYAATTRDGVVTCAFLMKMDAVESAITATAHTAST